jgi:hypothetical protein
MSPARAAGTPATRWQLLATPAARLRATQLKKPPYEAAFSFPAQMQQVQVAGIAQGAAWH